MDFKGYNQTFGPIFHPEEFLLPLLDLQEQVKGLVANITVGGKKEYVMLKDICNNPLSRPDKVRIFSEGHKIMKNLHLTFVYSKVQTCCERHKI